MPVVTQEEYKKRREKFLSSMKKESIAIFVSAPYQTRSNDTEYPYRQDSNFYYLTGFKEQNATLLLIKKRKKVKSYLFVTKKDPQQELWNGKVLGKSSAKKLFLVDRVYHSDKLEKILKRSSAKHLYYDFARTQTQVEKYKSLLKVSEYKDASYTLGLMRLIKSNAEIVLIKKAIEITKEAHHCALSFNKHKRYEYELQAEIEYIFKKRGAYSDAYSSIVASANNANTLHYISNSDPLAKDEPILIDAGCEYEYYASDITRTIPQGKRFTEPQQELYNMVLDVQKRVIEMVKPKVLRSELQAKAVELLTEGLVSLKILKGDVAQLIKKEKYKKYYPHGIGHWMGLDVHDASPYRYKNGKEIALSAGMVLTIEPGIYIDKDDKSVPKKYRGIGIRIEDDILVTKSGYENLSCEIKKDFLIKS